MANTTGKRDAKVTSASSKIIESQNLFQGEKRIYIRHQDELYQLTITSNGKLILTK